MTVLGPNSYMLIIMSKEHQDSPVQATLLSTGEMARQSGTTLRTVRFYEEAGLLRVTRTEGGHRLFREPELQKLKLACDLREAGLSLHDIKQLFELKAGCTTAKDASAQLCTALGTQIDDLQSKISLLRRLREELASSVQVIQECGACPEEHFPRECATCAKLERPDLPRAVRLLWRT